MILGMLDPERGTGEISLDRGGMVEHGEPTRSVWLVSPRPGSSTGVAITSIPEMEARWRATHRNLEKSGAWCRNLDRRLFP